MIAKDGLIIILITSAIFAILLLITYFFPFLLFKIISALVGIVFIFNFFFFRDPDRNIPLGEDLILSSGLVFSYLYSMYMSTGYQLQEKQN
jgi:hypothetical protein